MTTSEFKKVVEKHPPNWFVRFMYRWFNTETFRKPYPVGSWLAIMSFMIGTTGMIINDQKGNKKKATGFAWVILGFVVLIFTLPAYWMNQHRIRVICRELGITVEEYNIYINL